MIGKLLGGLTGRIGSLATGPLFAQALPWVLLALVVGIAGLLIRNASLHASVASCKQASAEHAAEDSRLATAAVEAQRATEDRDRAARAAIQSKYQEIRDGLEADNAVLRADLESGQRRVRPSLCAPRPSLPASGSAAGTSAEKPRDLASVAGRVIAAGRIRDAHYAELLALAQADRRACGVTP